MVYYHVTATSWGYTTCVKTTSRAGDMLELGWDGTCSCGKLIWVGIKQVGIFCAYMWVLAVSKKKKACPYFQFEDSNNKQ